MDNRWLKGIPQEEVERRKKEVLQCRHAFSLLAEVLEQQFEESTPDYALDAWAYAQADQNGANRKLRSILKLINIKEG